MLRINTSILYFGQMSGVPLRRELQRGLPAYVDSGSQLAARHRPNMLQRFDEATGLALWKAPNGPVGKLSETERVTYAQLEASKAQLLIAKAGRPDAAGVLECLERDGLGPNREAIDIADEEKPRRVTALSIAAQVGCAENVACCSIGVLLSIGRAIATTGAHRCSTHAAAGTRMSFASFLRRGQV